MINPTERSMVQLQSITPTTPDELMEGVKKGEEMRNRAQALLQEEIKKRGWIANGKKSMITIYDDMDVRLLSEGQRKALLKMWEEARPKGTWTQIEKENIHGLTTEK